MNEQNVKSLRAFTIGFQSDNGPVFFDGARFTSEFPNAEKFSRLTDAIDEARNIHKFMCPTRALNITLDYGLETERVVRTYLPGDRI